MYEITVGQLIEILEAIPCSVDGVADFQGHELVHVHIDNGLVRLEFDNSLDAKGK